MLRLNWPRWMMFPRWFVFWARELMDENGTMTIYRHIIQRSWFLTFFNDILLWICGEAFNEADSLSPSCRCARCDKIELHGRVMRVAPISDEKYGKPTARCGMPGGMMRVSKYSKPSMLFLWVLWYVVVAFNHSLSTLWHLYTWSVERFDTMVIPVCSHSSCGCMGDQWVNSKVHIQQGDDWKWCVFFV